MNHPITIDENAYEFVQVTKYPLIDSNNHQIDKYMLYIDTWQHKDKTKRYWNYTRIFLYDTYYNKPLFHFDRNYHKPPIIYAKQNGEEFLITSGNYQCISIYNITRDTFKEYVFPNDEALKNGWGFCPIEYYLEENTLKIKGCVWGGPIEIMIIPNVDLNYLSFENIEWDDYYKDEGE